MGDLLKLFSAAETQLLIMAKSKTNIGGKSHKVMKSKGSSKFSKNSSKMCAKTSLRKSQKSKDALLQANLDDSLQDIFIPKKDDRIKVQEVQEVREKSIKDKQLIDDQLLKQLQDIESFALE